VLINVARGLRQVEATHLELLRSYAATPVQVLSKARIPSAVPYLFTAIRIAAPNAVIVAFVAEYFGGPQTGLGFRITSNLSTSKNALAWAYVFGACLLGLIFYLVSILLESITTHQRGTSPGGGTS
jgi:NitT/TauT family transport system permease protein